MQVETITLDRSKARELYRAYKKHQHYEKPMDAEIRRAYQLLAQGRLVIKALESIKASGVDERGFPKLAIVRATETTCYFRKQSDGSARFGNEKNIRKWRGLCGRIDFPPDTFPRAKEIWEARAIVPPVPINLRPKRGLANYHILWEAQWERVVPYDPYLLRRIGKGDMWLVVAAWDLTEVERAALASRIM